MVVLATFLFSIPDFLKFIIPAESLQGAQSIIPLAKYSLGWVLPAFITFGLVNVFTRKEIKGLGINPIDLLNLKRVYKD